MWAKYALPQKNSAVSVGDLPAVQFLRKKNHQHIGFFLNVLSQEMSYRPAPFCFHLFTPDFESPAAANWRAHGWQVLPLEDAPQKVLAIIILDENMIGAYRLLGPIMNTGMVCMPQVREQLVSESVRRTTQETILGDAPNFVRYISAGGLRGNYVEFGTFIGSTLLNSYYHLRSWLKGDFYAFDSFAGLSAPAEDEKKIQCQ